MGEGDIWGRREGEGRRMSDTWRTRIEWWGQARGRLVVAADIEG